MQSKDSAPIRLRIYHGPDEASTVVEPTPDLPRNVTVPLGEVFPLLADAVRGDRAWLDDFADDEIQIPSDLYDVLMAYRHFRRPTA